MRIILYVALAERYDLHPILADTCAQLSDISGELDIDLRFHFLYSSEAEMDQFCTKITKLNVKESAITYNYCENIPLGRKFNSGLEHLFEINRSKKIDYILQCGCDDSINATLLHLALPYLNKNTEIIGCKNLKIVNFDTGEAKYLQFDKIFGAGRFLRFDLVKKAAKVAICIGKVSNSSGMHRGGLWITPESKFNPKIHKLIKYDIQLWPDQRSSGLDWCSEMAIRRRCYDFEPVAVDKDKYYVTDYKTEQNIHLFDSF
jgi:hypothetical protein